jgi:ABC-type phosphonate transport system ATPase subunit
MRPVWEYDRRKGARMGTNPIGKRLRPGRFDIGEVRRPHDGDEDLRRAHFAGQTVDDHRDGVAGVIDEQFVTSQMGLAHRNRELAFPASVQLAELRDLAKDGMTMLVVTHEMNFARDVADRVVFMDEGVIVEQGKPDEFFTQPKTERARDFLRRLLEK